MNISIAKLTKSLELLTFSFFISLLLLRGAMLWVSKTDNKNQEPERKVVKLEESTEPKNLIPLNEPKSLSKAAMPVKRNTEANLIYFPN